MKKAVSILMAICILFSITACVGGGDDDEVVAPPGGTVLSVWCNTPLVAKYKSILRSNPNAVDALLTQKIINDFEKENPLVAVSLSNRGWADELNSNLLTAIKSKEKVDVVCGETYIKSFMSEGYFHELNLADYKDDISDKLLNHGIYDDKFYAVPIATGSFSLLINKFVLRDAGILDANFEPKPEWADKKPLAPVYWEDLLDICKAIKTHYGTSQSQKGGIVITNSQEHGPWRALSYMRTGGGEYIDQDENFDLTSEANIKAYQMIRDLSSTAPARSFNYSQEQLFRKFNENDVAYAIEGIDPIVLANQLNTASKDYIVTSELPRYKENGVKANVLVGSVYYSVMESSEQKDMAEKFIKHMLKPEYQYEYLEKLYRLPVLNEALTSETIKDEKYHYSLMKNFLDPFINDDYVFNGGIPSFKINTDKIWKKWVSYMDDIYEKPDTSIATLAAKYNGELNAIKRK